MKIFKFKNKIYGNTLIISELEKNFLRKHILRIIKHEERIYILILSSRGHQNIPRTS